MSAATGARAHLSVVHAVPAVDTRIDLVRLCAGEPVLSGRLDLIDFVNSDWQGLDRWVEPGDRRVAEVALEWFHRTIGVERKTKGDAAVGIVGGLTRYILPFVIELAARSAADARGIAHLSYRDVEDLPVMLAGDLALPAATVAGDHLNRIAISCLWLTLDDAARVCKGGMEALGRAISARQVPTKQLTNGSIAIFAQDLRNVGLLIEKVIPDRDSEREGDVDADRHGLERSTATNVIRHLIRTIDYGVNSGADVAGNFRSITSIEPSSGRRLRVAPPDKAFIGIGLVRQACAHLTPTYQLALWLMRLVGLRIGELYGLRVSDFAQVNGHWCLDIKMQGGRTSLVRDRAGKLVPSDTKNSTKTKLSTRTVPVCEAVAGMIIEYIRIYHTDPESGRVYTNARLISGLFSEDKGGIAALRSALAPALIASGATDITVDTFKPHELRAALITDLKDANVLARLRQWYVGHEAMKNAHDGYDRGAKVAVLLPVVNAIDAAVADEHGSLDLRVPTTQTETWGVQTRHGRAKRSLKTELRRTGWLLFRGPAELGATVEEETSAASVPIELEASDVAERLDIRWGLAITCGTARRWMRDGDISAHQRPWGKRLVWVAYEDDVDRYARAHSRPTVTSFAAELGWSYHQTWTMLRALGRIDDRSPGDVAIWLEPDDVAAVYAEVNRRIAASSEAVLLADAADVLELSVLSVETLLRQGELELAPSPDRTRHRYVTTKSVEAFVRAHPLVAKAELGSPLVPYVDARRALEISRPSMLHLVTTRQLVAVTHRRRQHITLASLKDHLVRHPNAAVCDLDSIAVAV